MFDRKVIRWALSKTMKAKETSVAAFNMACINRPIEHKKLVFHSDRGIQYACEEFVYEISKYRTIVRSMSRKGNCWDNGSREFLKNIKSRTYLSQ